MFCSVTVHPTVGPVRREGLAPGPPTHHDGQSLDAPQRAAPREDPEGTGSVDSCGRASVAVAPDPQTLTWVALGSSPFRTGRLAWTSGGPWNRKVHADPTSTGLCRWGRGPPQPGGGRALGRWLGCVWSYWTCFLQLQRELFRWLFPVLLNEKIPGVLSSMDRAEV